MGRCPVTSRINHGLYPTEGAEMGGKETDRNPSTYFCGFIWLRQTQSGWLRFQDFEPQRRGASLMPVICDALSKNNLRRRSGCLERLIPYSPYAPLRLILFTFTRAAI